MVIIDILLLRQSILNQPRRHGPQTLARTHFTRRRSGTTNPRNQSFTTEDQLVTHASPKICGGET